MELFNEDTSAKGCSSGFGFVDGVWFFWGGVGGVLSRNSMLSLMR